MFICGVTNPNFTDFMYYFKLDVVGFSQFQYSILVLIGFGALLIGTVLYQAKISKFTLKT